MSANFENHWTRKRLRGLRSIRATGHHLNKQPLGKKIFFQVLRHKDIHLFIWMDYQMNFTINVCVCLCMCLYGCVCVCIFVCVGGCVCAPWILQNYPGSLLESNSVDHFLLSFLQDPELLIIFSSLEWPIIKDRLNLENDPFTKFLFFTMCNLYPRTESRNMFMNSSSIVANL